MSRRSGVIGAGYLTPGDRSWTRGPARSRLLDMTTTITRDQLVQEIAAGTVTVVETLRAEHFAQGHLPGAIHIHFEEIREKAAQLLPDKDAAIVTYCTNTACRNSGIAAAQLAALGYTDVRKYAEGKQDWEDAGLPLERSEVAA